MIPFEGVINQPESRETSVNKQPDLSLVIPAKAGIQRDIGEQTAGDLYFGKQTNPNWQDLFN